MLMLMLFLPLKFIFLYFYSILFLCGLMEIVGSYVSTETFNTSEVSRLTGSFTHILFGLVKMTFSVVEVTLALYFSEEPISWKGLS